MFPKRAFQLCAPSPSAPRCDTCPSLRPLVFLHPFAALYLITQRGEPQVDLLYLKLVDAGIGACEENLILCKCLLVLTHPVVRDSDEEVYDRQFRLRTPQPFVLHNGPVVKL